MANVLENEEQLKEEIFEDIAFSKAIAEGEETAPVSRDKTSNCWRRRIES